MTLLFSAWFARAAIDVPAPGQEFRSFFAEITRGGAFRGIYLTPTKATQEIFLKKIRKSYWVGLNNEAKKRLAQYGVDIWGDWYLQENAFQVILNSQEKKDILSVALTEQIQLDQPECVPTCPSAASILAAKWQELDPFSKQSFIKAYILRFPLFGGKTVLQILGETYNYSPEEVLASTRIRILSNEQFTAAVRELGYEGAIYFRGITAPDPKNPNAHVILLDEENIFKYSPFDRPVLKTLEMVGILTHELSHVFQDLKGKSLGFEIQVRSPEAALLLEGSAEHLAEMALLTASRQEPVPSALGLFVSEQAMEIIYREGNEISGNLFPYTVGLPFAAALYSQVGPSHQETLTCQILEFLGHEASLEDWLKQDLLSQ